MTYILDNQHTCIDVYVKEAETYLILHVLQCIMNTGLQSRSYIHVATIALAGYLGYIYI